MGNQAIRVIIKEPYKKAVVSKIKGNLKSLQETVGGYIEDVPFPTVDGVDLIINEDGKMRKLAGNFFLPHYQDCVVGTCIIASYNDDGQDKFFFHHPTCKPLNIIETLIRNSSKENDLVLDCFLGSGTTTVACKETKRDYIGIEINPKWYRIAKNRLDGCDANGQQSFLLRLNLK